METYQKFLQNIKEGNYFSLQYQKDIEEYLKQMEGYEEYLREEDSLRDRLKKIMASKDEDQKTLILTETRTFIEKYGRKKSIWLEKILQKEDIREFLEKNELKKYLVKIEQKGHSLFEKEDKALFFYFKFNRVTKKQLSNDISVDNEVFKNLRIYIEDECIATFEKEKI